MNSCKDCKYGSISREDDIPPSGNCYRYPPTPGEIDLGDGEKLVISQYPRVYEHNWCGEFKAKD